MIGVNPIVIRMVSLACVAFVECAQAKVLGVDTVRVEFANVGSRVDPLQVNIGVMHGGIKHGYKLLSRHRPGSVSEVRVRKTKLAARFVRGHRLAVDKIIYHQRPDQQKAKGNYECQKQLLLHGVSSYGLKLTA